MSPRFSAAIAVGAIVATVAVIHESPRSALATDNARSCAYVYHVYNPVDEDTTHFVGIDGVVEDVYEVQYRLHTISGDTWGSWTTPSETATGSTLDGEYGFKYTFSDVDPSTYDMVEWKVMTDENPGINLTTSADMLSLDGDQYALSPLTTTTCEIDSDNWLGFLVDYALDE